MIRAFFALALYGLGVLPACALDLLEAYELGLRNDPQIIQSEARRNSIAQNKPISVSRLLPNVAFNGDISGYHLSTKRSPISGQANTDDVFWLGNYGLRLTQPVFHYDAWVQLWQADDQIAQAEAELQAEYQNLAIRVAKVYFDVLALNESLEFSRIELSSLDSQRTQVNERLALGFATLVDLNEVQAQYDKVAADLILAEQKMLDAREALREIIGDIPSDLRGLPAALPLEKPEPSNVDAWREAALSHNLAIIAAQGASEVARRGIDLNYAGHLPTLDLVGNKALSDTNRPTGVQSDSENVGLYVNVPIFAGGGVNARVEQARFTFEQAQADVDKKRRAAERQVKDAFRGVLSAIGRVGALKTAVQSAESSLEGTRMGYQVGTRTVVDVLLEQSKLFGTKRDYSRARYDYLINGLLLKQAAGTLARSDIEGVNGLIHGKVSPRQGQPGSSRLEYGSGQPPQSSSTLD